MGLCQRLASYIMDWEAWSWCSAQARRAEGARGMRARQSAVGAQRLKLVRAAPLTARAWLGAWRLRKHAWWYSL
ncbi:hypothetical protein RR48_07597 [Papilio machaon]|uniref:Uncharacterized protein n=1 Tax=Papilio machaon TaxID=76193 RepID=A0A194QUF1_PAPMA|nr:hypothetical protein RR48_07597 [Papilio machaon]